MRRIKGRVRWFLRKAVIASHPFDSVRVFGFIIIALVAAIIWQSGGVFFASMLALVALVPPVATLLRTFEVQYTSHARDFLHEFNENADFAKTYFDLVYTYKNDIFRSVRKIADEIIKKNPGKPEKAGEEIDGGVKKPVFEWFEEINKRYSRNDINHDRFYHPDHFQLSPEEQRLDRLLDYFDLVGLYLRRGLVRIEDIAGALGDYLAVLDERRVVKFYIKGMKNKEKWKYNSAPPYSNLRLLLAEFAAYNVSHHARLESDKLEARIVNRRVEARRRAAKKNPGRVNTISPPEPSSGPDANAPEPATKRKGTR